MLKISGKGLALSAMTLQLMIAGQVWAVTPMTGNAVEARVGAMIDNMSESDKIGFIRVDDGRMIPKLDKFSLPGTTAYDSSMGVHVDGATFGAQYPSPSALAATWSVNRAKEFGLAIGYETRAAGGQQILTPGLNLYRMPFGGRATEYLSGEDPFIGAVLGPAVVNAVQVQGIQTAAKHYLANEQEANRHVLDVHVDERTLRELYLPGFESVVKNANVASVMCGFNKINDDFACENHHLITEVLKGEWGYQGFVLSDFNSINDAFKGAWAGTDLDMPSGLQFTQAKLLPYLYSGQLTQNVIDDKVRRLLRAMVSYGFDKGLTAATGLTDASHGARASLDMAREAVVLLKNGKGAGTGALLPLSTGMKIAVIGNLASDLPPSPFGTPNSPPTSYVTELSGLQQLASNSNKITYIQAMSLNPKTAVWYQPSTGKSKVANTGLVAEYFANTTLSGSAVVTRVEPGVNWDFSTGTNVTSVGSTGVSGFATTGGAFSARFTGQIKPTITGDQVFKARADGAYRLWIDGQLVLDQDGTPLSSDLTYTTAHSGKIRLEAGKTYSVKLEYRRLRPDFIPALGGLQGVQLSWASLAAPQDLAQYDAVVIAAGLNNEYEGEAFDHPYELPEFQSDMIVNASRVNPHTVVLVHGGGGQNMMPWSTQAGAILDVWYPGQEAGQAIGEILYGKVNPSGKLPISIEKSLSDNPAYASYPDPAAYQGSNALTDMTYKEGLYLGYRGYDRKNVKPLYPFGYGLSYTTYRYGNLTLSMNVLVPGQTAKARFTLTNTGSKAGFEVAQLYVHPLHATVDRPVKELKGFAKVYLKPGQSKTVTIPFDGRSLSYYQQSTDSWNVDSGKYAIEVGGSSADLPLTTTVTVLQSRQLTTRDSNPLPLPVQKAVKVDASAAY